MYKQQLINLDKNFMKTRESCKPKKAETRDGNQRL